MAEGPGRYRQGINAMRILASNDGPNQVVGTEETVQRSVHVALLLIFSIFGVAAVCLAALYLIAS
jgi:hypothetical protein